LRCKDTYYKTEDAALSFKIAPEVLRQKRIDYPLTENKKHHPTRGMVRSWPIHNLTQGKAFGNAEKL